MLPILLIGGVAAGYLLMKKPVAGKEVAVPGSHPGGYSPSQPSQTYPFKPPVPPRVDNANQPWYAGNKTFNDVASTAQLVQGISGATSSVVQNLSDVWGNLFPGSADDPKANLQSADSLPQDSSAMPMGGDQSGQVGDATSSSAASVSDASSFTMPDFGSSSGF